MRHSLLIAAPLAMFAFAAPALAGGAECQKAAQTAQMDHKKCTASKADCVKYMQEARTRGWVGIEYDTTEAGNMVVEKVVPGSPAEKAGLKPGDVLYAVNGVGFSKEEKEKLHAAKGSWTPGSTVTYSVKRDGAAKDVAVTLGTMPEAVYNAMVEEHMKEHVDVAAR